MAMLRDAVVGVMVEELLKAVLEKKEKAAKYKPTLEKLETTLKSLGPVIRQIEEFNKILDRPAMETKRLIEDMKSGKELVLKLSNSNVQRWNCCQKANYANYQEELEALDDSIRRFFELDLRAQDHRNGLETLVEVKEFRAEFTEFRVEFRELGEEVRDAVRRNPVNELRGVCSPPEPPPFTVGFDVPLNELKLKLLQDEISVSVLTVTGSGGSGKTTLAKMFCSDDQVKGKFKENIFFVTFAKTPKLNTIVQKLYQHIGRRVPELESDEDAVNQLEHLLKQIGKNPILLVLDNVWPGSESLVDNFVFPIPDYKILVTSRSAIKRFGAPYVLKSLGEADAINLFHHSASLNQSNSNIPDDVVKEIVRGCRGSPLALRVTGRSLSHQHLVVWDDRAKELSAGHSILEYSTDVLACLQKSLDVLDPTAIECFYDLVLFPEDQRIPASALVDMWAERHNEDDARAMVKIFKLVNLNMADIVVTRNVASDTVDCNYHYVTQYDLLRELAIRHTSQEQEDQRNRLIIDISGNNLPSWWDLEKEYHIAARLLSISTDEAFTSEWCNLQPPDVEVLVLNLRETMTTNVHSLKFIKYTLPTFIKKMNKLKFLIITKYDFYPAELENFELLDHLSHLNRIRLERVSIPSLSKTGVLLKNLQKLSLFMCNVNETFKNCTMPNLVEMNIDYCNMVELPVVLSNIVFLKKLSITNCHKLSALPEGIEKLVNLESLRLSSCTALAELPDSITSLQNLKFLDISDCINLTKLPENIDMLGNLEKLNVRGCSKLSDSQLPYSITELGSLRHVVCDEEMAALWEPFKTRLSELRLEVVQADFNLGFLHHLR